MIAILISNLPKLWPLPQYAIPGVATETLDASSFTFTVTGFDHHVLQSGKMLLPSFLLSSNVELLTSVFCFPLAFQRYHDIIFASGKNLPNEDLASDHKMLTALEVNVVSTDTELQLGFDESYILRVEGSGGRNQIQAQTIWGALRGLETFSQLVSYSEQTGYSIQVWFISLFLFSLSLSLS